MSSTAGLDLLHVLTSETEASSLRQSTCPMLRQPREVDITQTSHVRSGSSERANSGLNMLRTYWPREKRSLHYPSIQSLAARRCRRPLSSFCKRRFASRTIETIGYLRKAARHFRLAYVLLGANTPLFGGFGGDPERPSRGVGSGLFGHRFLVA